MVWVKAQVSRHGDMKETLLNDKLQEQVCAQIPPMTSRGCMQG